MKLYQILAIIILALFYLAYFAKMFAQSRRGIRTHQINKGSKPMETRRVEWNMSIATVAIVVVETVSIVFDLRVIPVGLLTAIGILIASAGVLIFVIAMVTMADSWRAGINWDEKTQLVTSGIYRFSRNPAFLGFDLMYTGIMLAFFNVPLLCTTVWAMVSLHLQILQEEKFLAAVLGDGYVAYKNQTCRYLGRKLER